MVQEAMKELTQVRVMIEGGTAIHESLAFISYHQIIHFNIYGIADVCKVHVLCFCADRVQAAWCMCALAMIQAKADDGSLARAAGRVMALMMED